MGVIKGFINAFKYIRYSDNSSFYKVSKNSTLYTEDGREKLELSIDHPTISSLVSIRADYLSKAKFYIEDSNGEKDFDDPLLDFIKNPNPHQSTEDFLKQYEWFLCAYGWVYQKPYLSHLYKTPNYIYNLRPSNIDFPDKMGNSLLITKKDIREYYDRTFLYSDVESVKKMKFSEIIPFFDVVNGSSDDKNSYITSESRLSSVSKEVSNILLASDAENKVLQTNGNQIVQVNQGGANLGGSIPMTPEDKENIFNVLNSKYLVKTGGSRTITPSKRLEYIDMSIKLSNLGLNASRETNSNIIAQRYQVPNEIYKAFQKGDTFENQRSAELNFIQNVITPRAEDLASSWTSFFGDPNRPYKVSFEHLPTMQIAEERKADKVLKTTTAIRNLMLSGFSEDDAISFINQLGLKIEKI